MVDGIVSRLRLWRRWWTPGRAVAACLVLAALAALFLLPVEAMALLSPSERDMDAERELTRSINEWLSNLGRDFFKRPLEILNDWLVVTLADGASAAISSTASMTTDVTDAAIFLRPFDQFFGGALITVTQRVNYTAVRPVAESLLGLAMLAQVMQLVQRSSSNGIAPGVPEVLSLVAWYVIFASLVHGSMAICRGVVSVSNDIGRGVWSGVSASEAAAALSQLSDTVNSESFLESFDTVGEVFPVLLAGIAAFAATFVARVVAEFVFWTRALQMYAYAMLAPIPMAMLGWEQTRQNGLAFIRGFAALALANVIAVFVTSAYPTLVSFALSGVSMTGDTLGALASIVMMSVAFIVGLVQSGSWAQGILGG